MLDILLFKMADFDFKDYLETPLTRKDLRENAHETKEFEFRFPARDLLTKDFYGFDIFKLNLKYPAGGLQHKNISSIRIKFVSTQLPEESIAPLLLNAKYNFQVDAFTFLFYGDFAQNKDLMQPGVIIPMPRINHSQDIYLNILNINNLLLAIVDDLEIVVSGTEELYNEAFTDLLNKKMYVEQWYTRTDTTCNLLRFCRGLGANAYGEDLERTPEEINELMTR